MSRRNYQLAWERKPSRMERFERWTHTESCEVLMCLLAGIGIIGAFWYLSLLWFIGIL